MKPSVAERSFGALADGTPVLEYTLDNGAGMQLQVLDYGCIIRRWCLTAGGTDLVLGYDTLREYECDRAYMGALVGRFANRINGGHFYLDGKAFQLDQNEGKHHLHGGKAGFHKQHWQGRASAEQHLARVSLFRLSPDGEAGYPGNLLVLVTYELLASGALRCIYQAVADQATIASISQHSYFNLAGAGDVLGHLLCIDAEHYLPVGPDLIPTGERAPVADGPFDLRLQRRISEGLCAAHPQLALAGGYDHNFVLNGMPGPHASLADPASGRCMEIYTDSPGMQFYSGNYLDGSLSGQGRVFGQYAGLCLEPQQFPDAPNHAGFPALVCRPGVPCCMSALYALDNWR
ncbi:galactose-1-epimerase [Pseudoduganella sp. DS3]|uniref:Aldose 1-epimerase n=1 Tax=Pseudoduganella guangdongensis TaxID=2692179 RepID=A0A6N9HJP2_9BURK|nr:aldose epimerase family protein [Pseudoduganella guangdongensis]MYN03720.1 galactose-1-epimerase [Pseudoduganella guangdongensis]